MPEPVLLLLCEFVIRFEYGEAPFGIEADEPLLPFAHLLAPPAHHSIVIHAECAVGDDQMLVYADDLAKAFTLGTSACGGVEGEHVVGGFLKGDAVSLEADAEGVQLPLGHKAKHHLTTSLIESRFSRVRQA